MLDTVSKELGSYQQIKADLHRRVLDRLNLARIESMPADAAREEISQVVRSLLATEGLLLSSSERDRLVSDVLDEIFGFGPLEPLLKDPGISDILVNRANQVYVERQGRLQPVTVGFRDDQHLMQIIERIVSRVGRRIDESSPMVDARLPDGSRVNAIIPPLALDGPCLSIRRFGGDPLRATDLVEKSALTADMMEVLRCMVGARLNVVVSGGTGAGKTTLLNVLSGFIPAHERVITIEDAAELQLKQDHVVRLETRPPNLEGKGAVRQRQLVMNSLRMRPDRIVMGEVRGEEAIDMLQAMNTGHEGSMTTIHANTPRDALARIETMVSMAQLNLPDRAVRRQIASAIHVIVQLERIADGSRKVVNISEVTGMEGEVIVMQDLFVFEKRGIAEDGRVRGQFRSTGVRPRCSERLAAAGFRLSPLWFEPVR